MKKRITRLLLLLILLQSSTFIVSAQEEEEFVLDCFSILVGKDASTDGSVIFGHNDDTGMSLVNTYKVPRQKHKPGEVIALENGGELPQVAETYSYIWMNMPGKNVCDTYINEHGVTVGSNGCPSKEKNPELTDGGIVYWIRRAVAERVSSAREGVEIAGALIDKYGYASSGRTYIIADTNEGWLLNAVNGKHWVAQRIPDDKIAVIPNYYTIGEIDLSDTKNFLGSPDIIEYAIEQGWYDPAKDGKFHFAKTYSDGGSLRTNDNYNRMWQGVNLVSGKDYEYKSELPAAVKPVHKVSAQNIMAVLRDHYIGTELDKTMNYILGSPYKMNGPTICAGGTQYSTVAHLRNWLPVEIGAIMWVAQYRPDVQAYTPYYSSMQSVPELYGYGDYKIAIGHQYNPPKKIYDRSKEHSFILGIL